MVVRTMFGGLLTLLVLLALGTGIVLWVRQSREPATTPNSGAGRQAGPPRRVSLLTEAIAYVGVVLVIAGGTAAVAQQWSDLSDGTRLTVLVIVTLVFLVLGFVTRRSAEPAFRRVSAISWMVSVAAFAGSVAVVNQLYDASDKTAFLSISATTTAYAAALWWIDKHAIQHALMFAGVLLTVSAIITNTVQDPVAWMICIPLWVIALGWTVLGWLHRIPPWWAAVPLGVAVALIAPASIEPPGAKYSIGIATAVAIMTAGVLLKFTPGVGAGAIGLFAYVVGAVVFYFRDTLGAPAALAIAGLLILVIAVTVARVLPFYRRKPPTQLPPAETPRSERPAA